MHKSNTLKSISRMIIQLIHLRAVQSKRKSNDKSFPFQKGKGYKIHPKRLQKCFYWHPWKKGSKSRYFPYQLKTTILQRPNIQYHYSCLEHDISQKIMQKQ